LRSILPLIPGLLIYGWVLTHTPSQNDTYGGRSHVERKWGVNFVNIANLTLYHGGKESPKSRLLVTSQ